MCTQAISCSPTDDVACPKICWLGLGARPSRTAQPLRPSEPCLSGRQEQVQTKEGPKARSGELITSCGSTGPPRPYSKKLLKSQGASLRRTALRRVTPDAADRRALTSTFSLASRLKVVAQQRRSEEEKSMKVDKQNFLRPRPKKRMPPPSRPPLLVWSL
jgi:hypothetical protein